MKTKAVVVAFHQYTPFGDEFYRPIFDFFIKNYREIWGKEVDKLYILDSTWNVDKADDYEVIKVDPSLRYYDAYKHVLPQIKEDLVLFMDNDMVVYREGVVAKTFKKLGDGFDVVSIYDTCGDYKTTKLNGQNKFCPYWFATSTKLLMKYRDCEWGPNMPEHETLGKLTELMLNDGVIPYEIEEDKNSILFDGTSDKKKNLGYYHVRAGSTPAYLLATKNYGDIRTYEKYVTEQPRNEYLRQFAWYEGMIFETKNSFSLLPGLVELFDELGINQRQWMDYLNIFQNFHGFVVKN